jgi:hypothetical protein
MNSTTLLPTTNTPELRFHAVLTENASQRVELVRA